MASHPNKQSLVCHVTPRSTSSAQLSRKKPRAQGGRGGGGGGPWRWRLLRDSDWYSCHSIEPSAPTGWRASETRACLYLLGGCSLPLSTSPSLHFYKPHPFILHSFRLLREPTTLLFMLIGIGCFGLWHRHLARTVNCSFLSHLAKELKLAIFRVRIRHLSMKVHIGKPFRSAEGRGAGSRMLLVPIWRAVILTVYQAHILVSLSHRSLQRTMDTPESRHPEW